MRAAVVTVSSSLARGEGEDVSGPRLADLFSAAGLDVSLETVRAFESPSTPLTAWLSLTNGGSFGPPIRTEPVSL